MLKRIRHWFAVQRVRDVEHTIACHRKTLDALPMELRRLELLCKEYAGRAATLIQQRDPVNWNLGR